jgi:uncharacterized protein YybS (DUF2232 family)
LVGEYGYPGTLAFKIVNNLGKINSVGKTYKALRSSLSKIENKFLEEALNLLQVLQNIQDKQDYH